MKVLVVEDGYTSRMLLRSAVEALGHECLTSADGTEAWDVFRRQGADVIVSDWVMPGIDGPELCRLVRAHPGPYTYFVILTAFGDRKHAFEGMYAGADDFLTKNVDMDDLRLRLVAAERVSALHKQLAEQDARLRTLAEVDHLTGLVNRHKSSEILAHLLPRAERQRMPLSLVVIDIDHFKLVNDRHGHATGDEVLRRVGGILRSSFREEDVVARWGGDEFVVGSYGVATAEIVARLRHITDTLHNTIFVDSEDAEFLVSVSCGVAESPRHGRDLHGLYQAADQALYRAKRAGRSRVVSADSSAPLLRAPAA